MGGDQETPEPIENSSAKATAAVREIYRPILRGYFSVFALYYVAMTPFNYWYLTGVDQFSLVGASSAAAVLGLLGCWYMRKPAPSHRVDMLLIAMNCLVVLNVAVALRIDFSTEKLTYFIISAMLFALASVNFKQSALSIIFAGFALISFLPRLDAPTFSAFAFLAFGAAMASLAIAYFLRKAIAKIADAKIETEEQLEDARSIGEEMRARSLSDSLTLLPNRRAFFAALRDAIQTTAKSPGTTRKPDDVWLILLDLDGFKMVNDSYGHLTGDLLLKQVAARLITFAGDDVHVSRMGGDEFNLILVGAFEEADIKERCDRLLNVMAETYVIEDRQVKISCSVGFKLFDRKESEPSLISQTDYALMVAKQKGKNCAVLFTDAHARQAHERHTIEEALRHADLTEEINLVFQPQFDLTSNTIVRAEVLARWDSPTVGWIEPERFIRTAEESGLITQITLVVIEKAMRELQSWPTPIPISINLSGYDLISDPTIDQLITLVEESDVDSKLIEFEVTETAMMSDFEKATCNLRRLSEVGFTIALDDFGTGYSNFSYLRALPITKLKVDKSFIESPEDPMTEKILTSLSGMARVLGVHCLLEGVEDELDLLMAKRAGAQSVQGYLFGRPMPSSELLELLNDNGAQHPYKRSA